MPKTNTKMVKRLHDKKIVEFIKGKKCTINFILSALKDFRGLEKLHSVPKVTG
jgi:Mn-dependent DtxR family transcriptional regulator